jgi:hypothetical protein
MDTALGQDQRLEVLDEIQQVHRVESENGLKTKAMFATERMTFLREASAECLVGAALAGGTWGKVDCALYFSCAW